MCGKGDAKGQPQEYEYGKLYETGTSARECGKQVCYQRDEKNLIDSFKVVLVKIC